MKLDKPYIRVRSTLHTKMGQQLTKRDNKVVIRNLLSRKGNQTVLWNSVWISNTHKPEEKTEIKRWMWREGEQTGSWTVVIRHNIKFLIMIGSTDEVSVMGR